MINGFLDDVALGDRGSVGVGYRADAWEIVTLYVFERSWRSHIAVGVATSIFLGARVVPGGPAAPCKSNPQKS